MKEQARENNVAWKVHTMYKLAVRFYCQTKWDYQLAESGPFGEYDEAVEAGSKHVENGGALYFIVEKRYERV